jgi:hypothetical protein
VNKQELTKFTQFRTKIDHLDFDSFTLTDSLKRQIANDTIEYEECERTKDELLAMTDEELAKECYSIWLDYVRGQGLI